MLTLAATEQGLCRVHFGLPDVSWLSALTRTYGLAPEVDQAPLAEAAGQLAEYATGQRAVFDLPLDLSLGTSFQQRVWQAARTIPYGQVVTYGELARMSGSPQAARAVGGALGSNPVPIVVPCHRVVAAKGALGGFSLGLPLKRALLTLEGVRLDMVESERAETWPIPGMEV